MCWPFADAPRGRLALLAVVALAGCRGAVTPVVTPEPAPRTTPADQGPPPLPPATRVVPRAAPVARGPLAVRVVYPDRGQLIAARDSNFLLGNIGAGDATLTINGAPVPVHPSGTFLAWLPLPPDSLPQYDLMAVRGADTVRRTVPIRLARRVALPAVGPLRVDSASLEPRGIQRWRPTDRLRVTLRAPANATVRLDATAGRTRPLVSTAELRRRQRGAAAPALDSADAGVVFATEVPARWLTAEAGARVIVERGSDRVVLSVPPVTLVDSAARRVVMLRSRDRVVGDTDRVVVGRPIPGGTYRWFLLPGTLARVTGQQNGWLRVRLDRALEIWVDREDVTELPDGTPLPRRVTGGARIVPQAEWVDVTIPLSDRPAVSVAQAPTTLTLTLHDVQANPEISPLLGTDPLVEQLAWEQPQSDRATLTLRLTAPAYGYRTFWDDARSALIWRIRRLPAVDSIAPLRGLTLVVDPGHPPAGATGPSGVTEAAAVLPVGLEVARLLEARGARVVLTRRDMAPVGLLERTVIAQTADAHAFLSVHLNALPDGVNPFTANGTSTLFFHQMSEPLAREIQRALVPRLGLRDLGIHYQNLAVARPTWYPSALAEGLFLILPDQEALVLSPEGQRAYAEGIVAGVEAYFRGLVGRRR